MPCEYKRLLIVTSSEINVLQPATLYANSLLQYEQINLTLSDVLFETKFVLLEFRQRRKKLQ